MPSPPLDVGEMRGVLQSVPLQIRFRELPHEGDIVFGVARRDGVRLPFAVSSGTVKFDGGSLAVKSRPQGGVNFDGMRTWYSIHDYGEGAARDRMRGLIDDAVCEYRYEVDVCPAASTAGLLEAGG